MRKQLNHVYSVDSSGCVTIHRMDDVARAVKAPATHQAKETQPQRHDVLAAAKNNR